MWFADQVWLAVRNGDGAMTAAGQATLTWGAPDYYGDGAFRPTTTYVMYRMNGEWLHLLPGHDVNGVTVAVESNRAVVSGLPTGLQSYEFAIRHIGRHVPNVRDVPADPVRMVPHHHHRHGPGDPRTARC